MTTMVMKTFGFEDYANYHIDKVGNNDDDDDNCDSKDETSISLGALCLEKSSIITFHAA